MALNCADINIVLYIYALYRLRDNICYSKTTMFPHQVRIFKYVFYDDKKQTLIKYVLKNTGPCGDDQIRTFKTLLGTFSKICRMWKPVQIVSAISATSLRSTRLSIL